MAHTVRSHTSITANFDQNEQLWPLGAGELSAILASRGDGVQAWRWQQGPSLDCGLRPALISEKLKRGKIASASTRGVTHAGVY